MCIQPKCVAFVAGLVVLLCACADLCVAERKPDGDDDALRERVEKALASMTLEEKADQLNIGRPETYAAPENKRLGIPPTLDCDGPRGPSTPWTPTVVCYPVALSMAATWNPPLIEELGRDFATSMIERQRIRIFSPGLNMIKHPQSGRNAEYLGEDPLLTGLIAAAQCRGIQSLGCIATPKHFVCNDFETSRTRVNVRVADRPLREIYLRAFEICVKQGNPLSIMTSYNMINGPYAAANAPILDICRKEWGFAGCFVSDYGADLEGTAAALNAGCNQDLLGWRHLAPQKIAQALKDGTLKQEVLDQRVREVLMVKLNPNVYDGSKRDVAVELDARRELARRVGAESMVLLKNERNLLPLRPEMSVALIGPFADGDAMVGNQGSSTVRPERVVTPLQEFKKRVTGQFAYAPGCGYFDLGDGQARIDFACKAEYFDNPDLTGAPAIVRDETSVQKHAFAAEVKTEVADGAIGRAVVFAGRAAVEVGRLPKWDAAADFTGSCWVYLPDESPKADVPLLAAYSMPTHELTLTPGGLKVRASLAKEEVAAVGFKLPPRRWVHVAFARKEGVLRAYVDGNPAGEAPMHFALPQLSLSLGGNASRRQYANAKIDEVRFYEEALDPQQIARLAARESVEGKLAFRLPCDEPIVPPEDQRYPGISNLRHVSARWTGKLTPARSGKHALEFVTNGALRVFLDGNKVIDQWGEHGFLGVQMVVWPELAAGREHEVRVEFSNRAIFESGTMSVRHYGPPKSDLFDEARRAARGKDVAVVLVGINQFQCQGEANDAETFELTAYQQELIQAVVSENPNTVVVQCTAGGVDMRSWIDKVPAVVEAFYPGQEAGRCLVDVLFGDVNPSGKLPSTYARSLDQLPHNVVEPNYGDSVCAFGYRLFDKKNLEPIFPFGHGLSYTTFQYGNGRAVRQGQKVIVSQDVTNSGSRAGTEVVQVYVGRPRSSIERAVRELKGFSKVKLDAGQTRRIDIELGPDAFAHYSPDQGRWTVEPGEFVIEVGSSSRDIRGTHRLVVDDRFDAKGTR